MSAGDSSSERLWHEILERLGSGDDVYVAEALKQTAHELATVLEDLNSHGQGPADGEGISALLEPSEGPAERTLAVLLPVVEYGGRASIASIPQAIRYVARSTSLSAGSRRVGAGGTLVLGRLIWALAAYALSCGRLDALIAAWGARTEPRHVEDVPGPLLADSSLRHADLYGRSADRCYEDYRVWLSGRELVVKQYPLFLAELDAIFAEADLILALLAALNTGRTVYSHGLTSQTVARFRSRVNEASQRGQLFALFGGSNDNLEQMLGEAYRRLQTAPQHWETPPRQLFPDTQ